MQFRRCASLFALYVRSGAWMNAARLSSAGSEAECIQQHLPISTKQQKRLVRRQPEPDDAQRLLKVAIIGAPNAGKSTLLNKLIGWKVAPVSQKVHTTRCKTLGVLTEDEKQVLFLDTPGIIVPGKLKQHKLQMSLLVDPHSAMFSADVVLVLVDVSHVWHQSRLDPEILKLLQLHADTPSILVLNKVDRVKKKDTLLNVVKRLTEGVVSNSVSWSAVEAPREKNIADLLDKTGRENRRADAVAGGPQLYSLQQSCDVLQSSYDDLYVDDDATSSVETSVSASHDDVLSKAVTDSVHGPLLHSFTLNSDTTVNTTKENAAISGGCSERFALKDEVDSVDGPLTHSFTSNADTAEMDVEDCATSGSDTEASDSDCDEPFTPEDQTDLYTPDVWDSYYSRLKEIGGMMKGREGWSNFDAVFMISAVDGDGVSDIKNYLLDRTYPSSWAYSSSVVTDQNPVKLAKSIITERLLDHLPDEVPYSIKVKLSVWTVEDNYLRASFDIVCSQNRQMRQVLRHIRVIAIEAKQELMNAFRREMSLQLVAVSTDRSTGDAKRPPRWKKFAQKQSSSHEGNKL